MREDGEFLKEENMDSFSWHIRSKRRILKKTPEGRRRAGGIARVTRLSQKIALRERSSGTQSESSRKNRTGT